MRYASPTKFALDYASSRTRDVDGRLRVQACPISRAMVCDYLADEIPDADRLGLTPGRVYPLYRDPDELAAAAHTFDHLPLLSEHVPVSSVNHQPSLVVGSTGSNASFDGDFLRNDLVVWAQDAIDGIEDDTCRELSSAYRYRVDPRAGNFKGTPFFGRMTQLVGNHVALIPNGRCGKEVMVADAMPRRIDDFYLRFPHAQRLKTAV